MTAPKDKTGKTGTANTGNGHRTARLSSKIQIINKDMNILVTGGKGQLATEIKTILETGKAEIGSIDVKNINAKFVDVDELRLKLKYFVPKDITREKLEKTKGERPFEKRAKFYYYELTFIREELKTPQNYPNCGAEVKNQKSVKCEYCDSPLIVKTDKYTLTNKKMINQIKE